MMLGGNIFRPQNLALGYGGERVGLAEARGCQRRGRMTRTRIHSGSDYVFRFNGSTWVEGQKLLASDGALDDRFGSSVAVSGNVAIVRASLDDDNGTDSGSVYVFRFNGAT